MGGRVWCSNLKNRETHAEAPEPNLPITGNFIDVACNLGADWFKSVDEVVRFYKLPNQKTKTSKDKVNSFSKSVCQCQNFK